MAYLYVLEESLGPATNYKVGISNNLHRRIEDLKRDSNGAVELIFQKEFGYIEEARDFEVEIHRRLAPHRIAGRGFEWYFAPKEVVFKAIREVTEPITNIKIFEKAQLRLHTPRHRISLGEARAFEFFINIDRG